MPTKIKNNKVKRVINKRIVQLEQRISELKKIETLKHQIEFILGATKTGLDIIDSQYNIRYIDPGWKKNYGNVNGNKCYEYFMGRKKVCPSCGIKKALETKTITVTEEILVKENNRPIQITTIPFKNKDGEWLVAEVNVDISQRKKAEEAQKQLIEIVEATPDFIGFAGANDKRVIYINKAGRKMCGIGEDEDVTKLKIYDVHPERTNKMLVEEILPAAVRDGIWTGECAFLDIRDRHEIPVSMVISSHKAPNGKVEVFSTISRDITERKKAEEKLSQALKEEVKSREILSSMLADNNQIREKLEQRIEELKRTQNMLIQSEKLVSLGKFVSSMAHEVNNPLTIISGTAQLSLKEEITNKKIKDDFKVIFEESRRASEIIQRLLKFSKPSKGEFKEIDINSTVDIVVNIMEHQFKLANIEIKRNYMQDLPLVSADEQQMHEVFMNLLNNAKEAMPERGVIQITTSREGGFLRIDFKDTGCGMTEEVMERMFEPFFTTKEKGTGLGLSVCYGIIGAHNGELKFASKPGEGTTATVLLPLKK